MIWKNRNILIWSLAYFIFIYTAYEVSMVILGFGFYEFVQENLFTVQKYFFDVSIFFVAYLFIMKKPFHWNLCVIRNGNLYVYHGVLYGLKICLFYIAYTMILFFGIPLLGGAQIQLNSSIFFNFWNLFSFLFATYLCYLLVLLLSGNQVFGILASFAVNSAILMAYSIIGMFNESFALLMEFFLMTFYTSIAIFLLGTTYVTFRKRDFLL